MKQIRDCQLFTGDCADILRTIGPVDAIITDPVWPGNTLSEFDSIDAEGIFEVMANEAPRPKRFAIVMNCDTDPWFVQKIINYPPPLDSGRGIHGLPFFRHAYLRYVVPGYKGRLLNTANIAYYYGEPPVARKGMKVIPGETECFEMTAKTVKRDRMVHPCPRRIEHMLFVVNTWTAPGDTVLDPFMGAGVIGAACALLGRKYIGIEIIPEYVEEAVTRIERAYRQADSHFKDVQPSMMEQQKLFVELEK